MNDNAVSPDRMNWKTRGAHWAKSAPKGKAVDDTINQVIIEAAGIAAGQTVLDLASGTGDPAISIALTVGEGGHVTATDANPEMLEGARARAAYLKLENLAIEVVRMENLPFDENRFDVVTCRFGLMHCDDPAAAAAQAHRVLKPGGRALFMVHGPIERNSLYPAVRAAVYDFLGKQDADGAARRFLFGGPGELTEIFSAAGFGDIAEDLHENTQTRPANPEAWAQMLARGFGAMLGDLEAGARAKLDETVARHLAPYLKGDHYEFLSSERFVCATK